MATDLFWKAVENLCVAGPPCMHHIMAVDVSSLKKAELTKLMKVLSPFLGLVRMNLWLVNTMNALLNYAGAIELEYSVRIADPRMEVVID